jgi:NADH-ubiquinone oxidoreductase chain 2
LVSINYVKSVSALSASLKYFLLSALSTGLFLLGVFLIYAVTGSTQYDAVATVFVYESDNTALIAASILILGSILFKLAAAPLHNWAPDLYDAVPTIITMYMMVIPKVCVLVFLLILSLEGLFDGQLYLNSLSFIEASEKRLSLATHYYDTSSILIFSAISSLIIGSLGLFHQSRIKRFLTYSGISHLGFILIALYCNDFHSYLMYTMIYAITSVNIFLILIIISDLRIKLKIVYITQLVTLFQLNPFLSIAFALSILSLAGCPPL